MADPLSKQVAADLSEVFRTAPASVEPAVAPDAPLQLERARARRGGRRPAGLGMAAAAVVAAVGVVLVTRALEPPRNSGATAPVQAATRADQALDVVVGAALKPSSPPAAPPARPAAPATPPPAPTVQPAETPTSGPVPARPSAAPTPAAAATPAGRPALDLQALASGTAPEAAAEPPRGVAAAGVRAPPCAGPPGDGCTDPELAAASRDLDRAFQDAQRAGVSAHDLRTEHDNWVSVQASAAALSREGLLAAYRSRIAQLRDLTGAAARIGAAQPGER